MITILIALNLVLSFIIAEIGRDKKIGYGNSFIISLVFGGLIGILIVIASQKPEEGKSKIVIYSQDNLPPDEGQIEFEKKQRSIFTRTF